MALRITPDEPLITVVGEEIAFELDIREELGDNTISSISYDIVDKAGDSVLATFGGGFNENGGFIYFGIKAATAGWYQIKFTVTCNELLPDGVTPEEFIVRMTLLIKK